MRFRTTTTTTITPSSATGSSIRRRAGPKLVGEAAAAVEEGRRRLEAEAAAAAEQLEKARQKEFEASLATEETVLKKVATLVQQGIAAGAVNNRTPLRMIASQLNDREHQVAATAGVYGVRSLLQEHGSSVNLIVTQDAAGVWYVESPPLELLSSTMTKDTQEQDGQNAASSASTSPSPSSSATPKFPPLPGTENFTRFSKAESKSLPVAPQSDEDVVEAADAEAHFVALRKFLPCGFFIPLTALAACLPAEVKSLFDKKLPTAASSSRSGGDGSSGRDDSTSQLTAIRALAAERERMYNALLSSLARMKANQVDVRVFGDKPGDVFVRGVCDNMDFSEAAGDYSGETLHAKFDHAALAASLYAALKDCGKVPIAELPSVLPPDLLFRLPLKGFHCILLFERMPHLFYANTASYIVEARDLSPTTTSSRIFTSLLVRNSPCPTELRYIVDNLVEPCALSVVERELPREMRGRLRCLFASLQDFVSVHSAYLFCDDPSAIGENGNSNASKSVASATGGLILCSHRLQQAAMDKQARIMEGDEWALSQDSENGDLDEMAASRETSSYVTEQQPHEEGDTESHNQSSGFSASDKASIAEKFAALQRKYLGVERAKRNDGESPSAKKKQQRAQTPAAASSSQREGGGEGASTATTEGDQQNAGGGTRKIMLNSGWIKTVTEDELAAHEEKTAIARERMKNMRKAAEKMLAYLPQTNGIQISAFRRRLPNELDGFIYKKHPRNFFLLYPDLFFTFSLYSAPANHYVQHAAFPRPLNALPRCRSGADVVRLLAVLLLAPKRLDVIHGRLPPDAMAIVKLHHKANLLHLIDDPKHREFFAVFKDKLTGEAGACYVGQHDEETRQSIRRKLQQSGGTAFVTPLGFLSSTKQHVGLTDLGF